GHVFHRAGGREVFRAAPDERVDLDRAAERIFAIGPKLGRGLGDERDAIAVLDLRGGEVAAGAQRQAEGADVVGVDQVQVEAVFDFRLAGNRAAGTAIELRQDAERDLRN